MSLRSGMAARRSLVWILAIGLLFTCITSAQAAQVTLAWDANDPTPDGYRLYQRTEGGAYDYATPAWIGAGTTCSLDNLGDDTTYYYVVRAYSGSDESGDSNEISYRSETPEPQTHTITASAGAYGEVSPAGATTVTEGEGQTYTISPFAGYRVADVLVDGVSVGAVSTYTFSAVGADHTISASFAVNTYSITASSGANGSVSPSGGTSVAYGDSQTYTITPSSGYHVSDVQVDGASVGAVGSYTFSNVSGSHTISADFAADTYTISASSGGNGTVSPSGSTSVPYGGSQTYTITPSTGYHVSDVQVDGASVGAVGSYTFSSVSGNHTISVFFAEINQLPVADAGPDQNVDEAEVVILSALNSMDPDDGIAGFVWRQVQGTAVVLSDATTAETSFTAPDVDVEGEALVFELVVTDNSGATAVDSCIVNVSWVNEAPTAQAGADQSVMEGDQVVLDASNSVDPDNGIAAYLWRQVQGPEVTLSDCTMARPAFTAPAVDLQGASMLFELTVTDAGGLQDTDQCIVTVSWSNAPPTADAGPDQQVAEGQEVYLSGANSVDPDDGIAAYQWRQTNGTPVVLSDATAVQPMFYAPDVIADGVALTFQLTVTDNGGLQHNDTCTVNISWQNEAPVAVAGADQTVREGETVHLDAGASRDSDDGIRTYQWNQTSGPAVTLSNAQSVMPTFDAPDVGPEGVSLGFQLTVIDYSGLQSQDECIVNVTWQNMPPVADAGEDQEAVSGDEVSLDGTASWDGDDGIGSYRWKQISGTAVTLQNAGSATTAFTAPDVAADTTLEFELTVTDDGGLQHVDRCRVAILADATPVLDTTPPSIAITDPDAGFVFVRRSKITLRGTASDDTDVVRVVWENDRGGSGQATGTSGWEIVDLKLSRWFNTITVTAYDAAGNQQSTRLIVFAGIWR